MKHPSIHACCLVVLLALPFTRSLDAQVTLDVGMGIGAGVGGPKGMRNREDLISPSATLAVPVRDASTGQWLVGLSLAGTISLEGISCQELPPPAPRTCRLFPSMAAGAVLAGWSSSRHNGRGFRMLGGPAIVAMTDNAHDNGMGFMILADGAAPIVKHLSFVGSARGLLAPRLYGQYLVGTLTLNAGVRVY